MQSPRYKITRDTEGKQKQRVQKHPFVWNPFWIKQVRQSGRSVLLRTVPLRVNSGRKGLVVCRSVPKLNDSIYRPASHSTAQLRQRSVRDVMPVLWRSKAPGLNTFPTFHKALSRWLWNVVSKTPFTSAASSLRTNTVGSSLAFRIRTKNLFHNSPFFSLIKYKNHIYQDQAYED